MTLRLRSHSLCSLVSPLRWGLLSFTTGEKVSVGHSLAFTRFRNFYKCRAGGKSHVLLQMTTRTPVFFKIKIFCTSSDLEKSNSNKDPPTSLLINTRFCRATQKLCFNCNSLKKSQKAFLCSVCTLTKKANKAQEGKVEIRKKPKLSALDTWVVTGQEQRPIDVLSLPQREGKQEHALETRDNVPGFSRKK